MDLEDQCLKKIIDFYSKNEKKYEIQKNITYQDKHKGQRCFIVGNGPSLKEQNLSKLENEIVFTVNNLQLYSEFNNIKTNYHVWADGEYFNLDLDRQEDLETFNTMKSVQTNDNIPKCFVPIDAMEFIKRTELNKHLDISYYNIKKNLGECQNIDLKLYEWIPNFSTVVQYAICIAITMGFSEIYLLGCDCTGFMDSLKYKSNINSSNVGGHAFENTHAQIQKLQKVYNRSTMKFIMYEWTRLFENYEQLQQYTSKRGIKLVNCTHGGLLDSLPRLNFDEIL